MRNPGESTALVKLLFYILPYVKDINTGPGDKGKNPK
jgi:hypothetical protein